MSRRLLWCVFALCFLNIPAHAASGQGDIGAVILEPRTLDLKELKKLCKKDRFALECELYKEKVKEKKTNKKREYAVFTANFE